MCITVDKENERLSLSLSKYYEPKILMAVCGQFHVGDLGLFFQKNAYIETDGDCLLERSTTFALLRS